MLKVRDAIQRDWINNMNLMEFDKQKCKSYTFGGIIPCTREAGDQLAGKQLCRKAPESPGFHQVEQESAMCSWSKGAFWAALGRVYQGWR